MKTNLTNFPKSDETMFRLKVRMWREDFEAELRKRMNEAKPKYTGAYFNGFFDACEEILGDE